MNIDLCPDTTNLPEGHCYLEFKNRVGIEMKATVDTDQTIEARTMIEQLYPGCEISRASLIRFEGGELTFETPINQ